MSPVLNFENPTSDLKSATPKSKYHQFYPDPNIYNISGPPYWMRHFEFLESKIRFGISDSRNLSITNFIQIRTFLIFQVRHIGSAILHFKNLNSDLDSATPKVFISQKHFWRDIFFFRLTVKGSIVAFFFNYLSI